MTDQLAHERIGEPEARKWGLMLHGVYGSLRNWRGFARRLTHDCPAWGWVLVDLPGHGGSLEVNECRDLPGVSDALDALVEQLDGSVHGVLGHSLGGKIALEHAARRAKPYEHVWVIDSRLGPESVDRVKASDAMRVMEMLRPMKEQQWQRGAFVDALKARGLGVAVAQWLAMNLRREEEHMVLGLNLDQIAGILDSYFRSDLWPVLEGIDAACSVQIAVAGRSDVFTPPERARLGAVVAQRDNVTSTDFESSGHWVHVDAPEDLARSITANLI